MYRTATNLYAAKKNELLQIVSVPKINLLENLGLRVGTQVEIQSRYAFGGPVLLKIESAFTVAVGKDIATQIMVRKVIAK